MAAALQGDDLQLQVRRLANDGYTMTCAGQAIRGDTICALVILEVFMVDDEDE